MDGAFGVSISDSGAASFIAILDGPSIDNSNELAVFAQDPVGNIELLARNGEPALGLPPGVVFGPSVFANARFMDEEHVFFGAHVSGPDVSSENDFCYYVHELSASTSLVLREGGPVPAADFGAQLDFTFVWEKGKAGNEVLGAVFEGPGIDSTNNSALFTKNNPSEQLAVWRRAGDQADSLPDGIVFTRFEGTSLDLNRRNGIAYLARLAGTDVDASNDAAIFSRASGSNLVEPVIREGDPVPTLGENVFVLTLRRELMAISEAGEITFRAILSREGDPADFERGFLRASLGEPPQVLVTESSQPAGLPSGVAFQEIGVETSAVNAAGDVAFKAELIGEGVDGTNLDAIFGPSEGGRLGVLARRGDIVPDFPTDTRIFNLFYNGLMNSVGQVVFSATLITNNGSGFPCLCMTDPFGRLRIVVAEGQAIDLDPDPMAEDLRYVEGAQFVQGFTDSGLLAFSTSFTDGSAETLVADVGLPCEYADVEAPFGALDAVDLIGFLGDPNPALVAPTDSFDAEDIRVFVRFLRAECVE